VAHCARANGRGKAQRFAGGHQPQVRSEAERVQRVGPRNRALVTGGVFDGQPAGLSRDDVLDNITITWLTNTAVSGARLYWEYWGKGYFSVKGVTIPVAVSAFPDELYLSPKSWSEQAYSNLIYYKKHDVGGHFAAWEQPRLISEDLRAAFRPLRQA
jgi:hypothetical protein